MSLIVPDFTESVIVRSADAEVIGRTPTTIRLLADAGSTGGALSTQRVTLSGGADGAKPHHHANSAELFYLLDGTAQLLSGDQVITAERGDLVIVPPGLAHAFAAAPGHGPALTRGPPRRPGRLWAPGRRQ
jgi:mannose-6-phosphate isomerase-like protein (cupin superfamily)